jgi:phosphocarrier protein
MSGKPLTRTLTIKNELGLHARPAARFVECAGAFDAEITVTKDGETVPGTSIMGLLMFGAGPGTALEVAATGAEAAAALDALEALIDRGFGEISD